MLQGGLQRGASRGLRGLERSLKGWVEGAGELKGSLQKGILRGLRKVL